MGGLEAVLLLAGIAGVYLWNLSRAAGNLQYYAGNITGYSLVPPLITVDLMVQNTSNVTFTINSLAANVTSDGTQIGNISDFTPVTIPANSQGAVPLTLRLLPIGLVNDIISIITGGSGSRNILIQGTVNANGVQQPFELPYKIGF
jgi:LEA14-like dessication related protein